jgi:hypothetical protein
MRRPVLRASGLSIAILLGLIIASARVDKIMALREEALAKKSRAPPPLSKVDSVHYALVCRDFLGYPWASIFFSGRGAMHGDILDYTGTKDVNLHYLWVCLSHRLFGSFFR